MLPKYYMNVCFCHQKLLKCLQTVVYDELIVAC